MGGRVVAPEFCNDLGLGFNSLTAGIARAGQDFQGEVSLDLGTAHAIDFAHVPCARWGKDFVTPESRSGKHRHERAIVLGLGALGPILDVVSAIRKLVTGGFLVGRGLHGRRGELGVFDGDVLLDLVDLNGEAVAGAGQRPTVGDL